MTEPTAIPAHAATSGGPQAHPLVALIADKAALEAGAANKALAAALEVLPAYPTVAQLKKALVGGKVVADEPFSQAVAAFFGLAFRPNFEQAELLTELAKSIPIRYAKKFVFFPFEQTDTELVVALDNPENAEAAEDVGRLAGKTVRLVVSTHAGVLGLINRVYDRAGGGEEQKIEGIEGVENAGAGWGIEEAEDLIDARDEEPIKRLLNNMLYQATRANASDVHIDSNANEVVVRFRVDGVLSTVTTLPKAIQLTLINRIKIMSRLDISQRGLPQDGRTLILIAGRRIDIRVSTLPTVHGEKAVMRMLYQDEDMFSLPKLGMPPGIYATMKRLILQTGGIILVCGPTGSGKTTTLYAALGEIDRDANNIMTIEDPVEYKLPGYVQTEVNAKLGLTFASALRSVLRQDPDIIMVGEMRDRETGLIAIQAALTGHLVFSTLHTNDAASSVTRLVDMGIEPYLVSSTLIAVLSQRLLRRICPHCREAITPDPALLYEAGLSQKEADSVNTLYKGAGCAACRNSGYLGRVATYELLTMTEPVKKALLKTNEAGAIREAAIASGMMPLRQHGLQLIRDGITTAEELVSAARED